MADNFVLTSWPAFKALAATKQLGLQYTEFVNRYDVYINEGILVWQISLTKDSGTDVTDFETTYKALSNRPSFLLGQFRNKYTNIAGNATTVVKNSNGVVRGISINNNNTGGTITVYDNTAGNGTKIATIEIATPSGGLLSSTGQQSPVYVTLTAEFTTGLTVVTSGSNNNNVTVFYV